ncbi:ISNCY family transposase [Agrobacterium sp.]|uniref:ISNCY family transposase n=1 Tax=Agrobacterium sp. TaxID=361 RepID=UPI0028A8D838|nr:ISNCY family transposase [Agrobacterium sp.]
MSFMITMSQKELHRLELIQKIRDERLSVVQAAEQLGLSRSQVHRLLQAYDRDGPAGLVSKKRSRPSNRRHSEEFRNAALDLIRDRYLDFGPTLAREKLIELHHISVAKETLRQWMTEAGIWVSRKERKKRVFQPRGRRDCFGELVQIDGSHHWWFENRGPKCALLVYIDDATGKLLHLRFAGSENTFDYLHATKSYLQQWGKPLAFYSDKHGVFRSLHPSKKDRTSGLTQFGRALCELSIEILCANSSQAKGRVERMNRTLQDRLVKELRLAGIDSMEAGNAFLSGFMEDYNARFAVCPARSEDLHRPVNLAPDRLKEILCKREQRYVGSQLTFSYERQRIMLEETDVTRGLVGKYVETYAYADGRLDVRWKGHRLPYTVFAKDQRVTHAAITENKRLGDVLAYIKERQEQLDKPKVKSNSDKNGYVKRARGPGRRKDLTNDPAVIARRKKALSRQQAAE